MIYRFVKVLNILFNKMFLLLIRIVILSSFLFNDTKPIILHKNTMIKDNIVFDLEKKLLKCFRLCT